MIKQRTLIGTRLDDSTTIIEHKTIDLLNRAVRKNNFEGAVAEKSTKIYSKLPPYMYGSLMSLPNIYKALNLSVKNVLLCRESVVSHKDVYPGDKIYMQTFLKDLYEQHATQNPIGFAILESIGSIKDDAVFYLERVLLVRGGFVRR